MKSDNKQQSIINRIYFIIFSAVLFGILLYIIDKYYHKSKICGPRVIENFEEPCPSDQEEFGIEQRSHLNDTFLIKTEGCTIYNYAKHFKHEEPNHRVNCGIRAVFVEKISENVVQFLIEEANFRPKTSYGHRCCYKFIRRSTIPGKEDSEVISSGKCIPFQNESTAELEEEIISISCRSTYEHEHYIQRIHYKDFYMLLKSDNSTKKDRDTELKWNILILGMDTMSRARAYDTMPRTVNYFKQNGWLDYKTYHKVARNTYPNLMALLTGRTGIFGEKAKDLIVWNTFQGHGYKTAYGEDDISCPDTFKPYGGFRKQPTDHYMRPLFIVGDDEGYVFDCTGKLSSGEQLLNYAFDFAHSYHKLNLFFGLFWMNSLSHHGNKKPSNIDTKVRSFFEKLNNSNIMETTFVMFVSDHGIRYGKQRYPVEAFFDERLPMLFIWTPHRFREVHPEKYANAVTNQQRLVTTYDIHDTLLNIFRLSECDTKDVPPAVCLPYCSSIFEEHDPSRTCADALIIDKWCCCHELQEEILDDERVRKIVKLLVRNIKKRVASIPTMKYTKCDNVELKSVMRAHSYSNKDKNIIVIAMCVTKSDVCYEGVISYGDDNYIIEDNVDVISVW